MSWAFGPFTQPANSTWEWWSRPLDFEPGSAILVPVMSHPPLARATSTYHGNFQPDINDPNPYKIYFCNVINTAVVPITFYLVGITAD
jgi:hypothetical protein